MINMDSTLNKYHRAYKISFERNDAKGVAFSYLFFHESQFKDDVEAIMDALNRASQYLQKANGSSFAGIKGIEQVYIKF